MKTSDRWNKFLKDIHELSRLTLVGPFAEERANWPRPAIFVDRGNRFQTEDPLHISVGDGDSASRPVDQPLPPNKNYSDLAFALSQVPENIVHLDLIGFLGGRRDHEWIGIGEAYRFTASRSRALRCDFDSTLSVINSGVWSFDLNGTFSLMPLRDTFVKLTGDCRFTLPKATKILALSSHGLSNEGHGRVHIQCDAPVLIFWNIT